jgi:hypothetical protein
MDTTSYLLGKKAGGGSGGTSNYNELTNKPSINGVELAGNKSTSNLGILEVITSQEINNLFNPVVDLYYDLTDGNWSGTYPEYYSLNEEDIIDPFLEDCYYALEGSSTFNLTIYDGEIDVAGVCTPIDDITATWVSEDEQTTATIVYGEIEEADYEWGLKITYNTEEGE